MPAVIPAITTEDQRLPENSVSSPTGRLVQIIAAAIAGSLIALAGTRAAFGINAATFVVSALLLIRALRSQRMPGRSRPARNRDCEAMCATQEQGSPLPPA